MKSEIKENAYKKRIAFFSIYDKEGIIDDYICYFVESLMQVVIDIVFIINGKITIDSKRKLKRYSDRLIIRKNIGFDAGAYKYAMFEKIGIEIIKQYDEIILCNDTCYGPFVTFNDIFSEMGKKNKDFWGIDYVQDNICNYLMSNFLVFGKSIIQSEILFDYFRNYIHEDTNNIYDVCIEFERGIFTFLQNKGYTFGYYTKQSNCNYYKSPNWGIKKYGYPFMKKKTFLLKYFQEDNVYDALKYIETTGYDIQLIIQNAKRKYGFELEEKKMYRINNNNLKRYLYPKSNIDKNVLNKFILRTDYIYGAGLIARCIFYFHKADLHRFRGFIVTNKEENEILYGYPIISIKEINLTSERILVALNPENTEEIKRYLSGHINIMYLW